MKELDEQVSLTSLLGAGVLANKEEGKMKVELTIIAWRTETAVTLVGEKEVVEKILDKINQLVSEKVFGEEAKLK